MGCCETKLIFRIAARAGFPWRLGRHQGWPSHRPTVGVLRIALFVILGSIAHSTRAATATPASSPKSVAVLNIQFLNDHADLEPTTDAERARLASALSLLKAKLETSGQYRIVSIPADEQTKIDAGPEIGSCGGCEYDYGKQVGAEYAAWIVVQKVSDLILNMNVYIGDVAARKLTFVHSVDIRGNTDESWTRGLTYLVKNYLLPAP
jgi:hypothetical protein